MAQRALDKQMASAEQPEQLRDAAGCGLEQERLKPASFRARRHLKSFQRGPILKRHTPLHEPSRHVPSHQRFAARSCTPLANAHQQIGLETATTNATPHKLIELLFEGFADAVARACGALLAARSKARSAPSGTLRASSEEGSEGGAEQEGSAAASPPTWTRSTPTSACG